MTKIEMKLALGAAYAKINELEFVIGNQRALLTKAAVLELRLTASDAECTHWQLKAEQLADTFIRTGTLSEFDIKRMP